MSGLKSPSLPVDMYIGSLGTDQTRKIATEIVKYIVQPLL